MLGEVLEGLNIDATGRYVDATFGRGGHSRAILSSLSAEGRLLGLDRDPLAVAAGQGLAAEDSRFSMKYARFSQLEGVLAEQGWNRIDGVLLDVGVSSPQLDEAQRGFSFMRDGPLDMRMDPSQGPSAEQWLAKAREDEITEVLKTYGEERFGRRIARAVVETRETCPLQTTRQLVQLVETAQPVKEKHKHPATRTFQAIRIFINNELDELVMALRQSLSVLAPGGRLAVISFHSLEDRIVKRFFRDQAKGKPLPRGLPVTDDQLERGLKLVSKAVRASFADIDFEQRTGHGLDAVRDSSRVCAAT